MMRLGAAILALACAAPAAANAAALPITGSYGNALGCGLARTGAHDPVEGDAEQRPDKVEIEGTEAVGSTVRFADGTSWGPLKGC